MCMISHCTFLQIIHGISTNENEYQYVVGVCTSFIAGSENKNKKKLIAVYTLAAAIHYDRLHSQSHECQATNELHRNVKWNKTETKMKKI